VLTRSADDVWQELMARCSRLMRTSTPVLTLDRKTANWITAVDLKEIRRRSDRARGSEDDSPVPAAEVARIWQELRVGGNTTGTSALRLAYALLGRLIDGVQYETGPFRLLIGDEAAADRLWSSREMGEAEVGGARAELLRALRELRVYRDND
jgi:hypothetical protein